MPILESKYQKRPWYFLNRHFETIIPSIRNKSVAVKYDRQRLELADGDFLDLDWVRNKNKRLIVLSHGLEGNSERHYIQRPAHYFSSRGWDILAWNNRSCSGEMNRLPRFYHHGATEDLAAVIEEAFKFSYDEIVLLGYSMGGGMQQKYLGERVLDERIKGAISFSVPCYLPDSISALQEGFSQYYERRFVKKIKEKILKKSEILALETDDLDLITNFKELDSRHTIRHFKGYADTDDFYDRISSLQFLPRINVPVLIVNALNDPMLSGNCFPYQLARESNNIYLETPRHGGHVGFFISGDQYSYMEYAAADFIEKFILPFSQS